MLRLVEAMKIKKVPLKMLLRTNKAKTKTSFELSLTKRIRGNVLLVISHQWPIIAFLSLRSTSQRWELSLPQI